MGTTAQKLEYLGTTKSQLKDMINYGLDEDNKITSSTTFREYVSSIFNAFLESLRNPDTLFTNLPKKSGSGSNIALNDTANAPMRIELGASELTQAGTPTPDSPQDIHTISGSNTILVRNRNLWNEEWEQGYYNSSGEKAGNSDTAIRSKDYILVQPNTNYYYYNGTNSLGRTCFYDKEKNFLSTTTNSNKVITTPANCYYITISTATSYGSTYLNDICINISDSLNGTYTKSSSQEADIDLGNIEYCKIGNYEDKFIRTSGKNLIPFTNQDFTKNNVRYYAQDGNLYLNGTSSGETYFDIDLFKSNFNFYLSAGTYTLKKNIVGNRNKNYFHFGIYKYDDNTKIARVDDTTSTETFTLSEETKVYVGFYVYQQTFNNETFDLQINIGSTALEYEPYGSNEWYIKKNIGKVVLDGSSDESYAQTYSSIYQNKMLFDIQNILHINSNYQLIMCDRLKALAGYTEYYDEGINCTVGTNSFRLILNDTEFNTYNVAALRTWLANNVLRIYYVLTTPTYTPITGTLANQLENVYKNMLSQKGQTTISQINADLPFNMSIQAIEDISNE